VLPSQGEASWSSILVFMGGMFITECSEATELGEVIGNPPISPATSSWLASATLMGRGSDIIFIIKHEQRVVIVIVIEIEID